MRLDHGLDNCAYQILEWCSSVFYNRLLNHAINLIDVTLVQRVKDRSPIGKVLVKRANTHPGHFGYPVGSDAIGAAAFKKPYSGIQHRFDRFQGPSLRGTTPQTLSRLLHGHSGKHIQNVSNIPHNA